MEDPSRRYVVVTPVRNEAEHLERTIESMARQTVLPAEWVIVDDGSTDGSRAVVERHLPELPWLRLVGREDRGLRQRGKGVVDAFYHGFRELAVGDYGFVVKLDGDLSFEPGYFEFLLRKFAENPRLGLGGGAIHERPDAGVWIRSNVRNRVRGATKMYRRECFEQIGGLFPSMGWDGIDEWKARSLGWEVRSYPEMPIYHYRYTGAATGKLRARIEEAHGAHFMGYHPLFLIARGLRRIVSRPYLIGGLAMIVTYLADAARGKERMPDTELIRYIRREQLRQLRGLLSGRPIHEV